MTSHDVFISHAGDDAGVAVEVCALLEKRGLKCWMAPRDVAAGSVWDEAILDAIETSRAFLLILSASANKSQFVKNEVNRAFSQGKPIVTFRLEEVVPGRSLELYLARHHWTDAFPPPLAAHVETLATSISALLDSLTTVLPAAPPPPPVERTLASRLLAFVFAVTNEVRALGRIGLIVSLFTLILGVAMTGLFVWKVRPAALRPVERPMVRLNVDLGTDVSLGSPYGADMILSPDGTRLVYVSQGRLFTRRLDQPNATELAGTQGAYAPFFSPDGQWVAFFSPGKLQKISVEGGSATTVCNAGTGVGGSWGEDGNIIAALNNRVGLSRIPSAGGPPTHVTELADGEGTHRWPEILPGGKAVLFTANTAANGFNVANIEVMSFADHSSKTVVRGGTFGRYLPSGYLIYVNQGTLFAVPFDLDRLEVHGTPAPVLDQVGYNLTSGTAQFDFSQTGTMIYRSGDAGGGLLTVQWLDAAGKAQPLLTKPGVYVRPILSPDGNRLAIGGTGDIWVYEWRRDTMTRLTFGPATSNYPIWSPDGQYILYRGLGGIFWTRSDGAGKPRQLTQSKNTQYPWSFAPDGKRLAFEEVTTETGYDLWTVPLENDASGLRAGKPEPYLQTPFDERHDSFSPDGQWLAYASNESGAYQVYVRAFPDKGGKWQISNSGGVNPVWSRNGHELFYRTEDAQIMVASYTVKGDSFVADKPRVWSEKRIANIGINANYDLAPDGKRIVALMPVDTAEGQRAQSHVTFLLNFFDEVRRRTATQTK